MFHVDVLTLFPDFFVSPLSESILRRATNAELLSFLATNIRDFATDKHHTTDDIPYGGGAGMVMKPEPVVAAIEDVKSRHPKSRVVYLTPQGIPFKHVVAERLSKEEGLILVCGHYEGLDQRVRDHWIDEEISIGDYVLTGGEPAALVVLDAVVRLRPGVIGNADSLSEESFSSGALEYPHYTRPRDFRGHGVPDVLLSGHHGKIEQWRQSMSAEKTATVRPDLSPDLKQESDD